MKIKQIAWVTCLILGTLLELLFYIALLLAGATVLAYLHEVLINGIYS